MSLVQGEAQGRRAEQVLPCLLLRLSAHALRDEATQVPQVQCRIRRQRLPPPLPVHLRCNYVMLDAYSEYFIDCFVISSEKITVQNILPPNPLISAHPFVLNLTTNV